MYLKVFDWMKYGYQWDFVYENVILYVVFEEDLLIIYQDGICIFCLELYFCIFLKVVKLYKGMQYNIDWILC